MLRLRHQPQTSHIPIVGVVQVRSANNGIRFAFKCSSELGQERDIPPHLFDRMQNGARTVCVNLDQILRIRDWPGMGPLLQLDDDVRRAPGLRVNAC
jgi:hypothetical protein